jgi:ankyrin repeat protein
MARLFVEHYDCDEYARSINMRLDSCGHTAFHHALLSRHGSLARFLAPFADLRIREFVTKKTTLHLSAIALRYIYNDEAYHVLSKGRHFLEAVNNVDEEGKTALHYVCENGWATTCDAMTMLLEFCDVNISDKRGKTALHYAVEHRWYKNVDFLLTKSADASIRDNDGNTPYALACHSDRSLDFVFSLTKHCVATGDIRHLLVECKDHLWLSSITNAVGN